MLTPTFKRIRVIHPSPAHHRGIDCFYVYPTVSDQKTIEANLHIDPEERSIARYEAARYSQYCRVYAPMYRQVTLAGMNSTDQRRVEKAVAHAYASVLSAWKDYLAHYNHGRGFVLIGHSQGSDILIRLIHHEIDGAAALRERMVLAIILGGDVVVRKGRDVGGAFHHVPGCRTAPELRCVIAFSTFNQPVPKDSLFGRVNQFTRNFGVPVGKLQVLCTNPAALGGGSGLLDSVVPSQPFAPNTTIGQLRPAIGFNPPKLATTWAEVPGAYRARCSTANGASVLEIRSRHGAPKLHPVPDQTWGLHFLDGNIALGNLVRIVGLDAAAYADSIS